MMTSRPALTTTALVVLTLALAGCQKQSEPAPGPTANTPPAAAASGGGTAQAYELAARGHGFSVGPMMAAQVVYVFFDPACPRCAQLWAAAQPLTKKVRFVWLPVGFLKPQSTPQGATILAAADPVRAMNEHEASVLAGGPGLAAASNLPAERLDHVKANTALWQQAGGDSVPLLVYRQPGSGQSAVRAGALGTEELAALLGV